MNRKEGLRLGPAALWAKYATKDQRRARTQRARDGFWARWLAKADPHGELDVDQRIGKARELRRLYYVELGRIGGSRPKRKRAEPTE